MFVVGLAYITIPNTLENASIEEANGRELNPSLCDFTEKFTTNIICCMTTNAHVVNLYDEEITIIDSY